jgi:hypothetical protein
MRFPIKFASLRGFALHLNSAYASAISSASWVSKSGQAAISVLYRPSSFVTSKAIPFFSNVSFVLYCAMFGGDVLRRRLADVSTPTTERKTLDKRLISVYTGGRNLSATAFFMEREVVYGEFAGKKTQEWEKRLPYPIRP